MKKTILVIEDDRDLRTNIKTLLEEEDYSVIIAKDGEEGIKLAKEILPSLIICDILMPNISGYDVLEALLTDKKTFTIPFIFLTAKVDKADLRKGMELGADDYVFKPFQSETLLKSIETRIKKNDIMKAELLNNRKENKLDIENKKELGIDGRIFFVINDVPQFIKVCEIKIISAENQYSNLLINDGRTLLLRKSLAKWEQILPANKFLRIHRSTIINMDFMKKIERMNNNSFRIFVENVEESFIISRRAALKLKSRL